MDFFKVVPPKVSTVLAFIFSVHLKVIEHPPMNDSTKLIFQPPRFRTLPMSEGAILAPYASKA